MTASPCSDKTEYTATAPHTSHRVCGSSRDALDARALFSTRLMGPKAHPNARRPHNPQQHASVHAFPFQTTYVSQSPPDFPNFCHDLPAADRDHEPGRPERFEHEPIVLSHVRIDHLERLVSHQLARLITSLC